MTEDALTKKWKEIGIEIHEISKWNEIKVRAKIESRKRPNTK